MQTACTDSCNTNSTNLMSTISNITVNVYYSICTVRIIHYLFLVGSSQIFISLCTKSAVLFACNKHTKCVKLSLIHDNHIIANCYTTVWAVFWFLLSFSPHLSQSFSLSLQLKHKIIHNYAELAHIKWTTTNDEHSTGLWYLRLTNISYITLTEDIKLYFRTLSTNNKTVNTAVLIKTNTV